MNTTSKLGVPAKLNYNRRLVSGSSYATLAVYKQSVVSVCCRSFAAIHNRVSGLLRNLRRSCIVASKHKQAR